MPAPAYQFDPTAVLPANKIINELKNITVSNSFNAFLIIPDATPFYQQGFSIVDAQGNTLAEGVHYYLTHHWQQASNATGLEVYGSITMINGYPIGLYKLNYQTIGGEYVSAPDNAIQSGLIADAGMYISIDWATAPTIFPPTAHTEDLNGITGMQEVYHGLLNIANAIRDPNANISYDDVQGITEVYTLTTVKPFLNLVETIYKNNNALGALILDTLSRLQPMLIKTAPTPDLQHFDIPLPGGFILKVGMVLFEYQQEPATVAFTFPPFLHRCLYAAANINFKNPTIPFVPDKAYTSNLQPGMFHLNVIYDPANVAGVRVLTYFALGI